LEKIITENFCREQTLAAAALRQHQKPIRYALCQRKGPSPLSEMTDINSNYESDSKKPSWLRYHCEILLLLFPFVRLQD